MASISRRSKCPCCNALFTPDYRNRNRQRFCSKPACRGASKKASQRAWLAKNTNADYFRGPENTRRNRQWRDRHPGYWRQPSHNHQKPAPEDLRTQQDPCSTQGLEPQALKPSLENSTQQDSCLTQLPLVVGLIAILTESTQQDHIDASARRLHRLGARILAASSSSPSGPFAIPATPTPTPAPAHEQKPSPNPSRPRPPTADPTTLQLDRPPARS
jgi:hypothetical protein